MILISNKEASLNVECIYDDLDFSYSMKREEFEKINKGLAE